MIRTDLHIHSCLSPCADDEMTPFDLVGLSKLNGLELIALTDHNSTKNCPAAALAAREYGIGFIPGAEVNTAEDIHCICLFPSWRAPSRSANCCRRICPTSRTVRTFSAIRSSWSRTEAQKRKRHC
jgi:predicted metal-dependent phosphoesterase TrpH